MDTSKKEILNLIHQSSSWKQHTHTRSFHPQCLETFWWQPVVFLMSPFFPSCVWWMFDSTSHGLRRIWPYPAQQATKALKYSHPGAAEWTPFPDSLFKVNNAPAVTPSMRLNHINEVCRREIQREVCVCVCVCVCIFVSSCAVSVKFVMLQQSATVLKACLLSQRAKFQLLL